jgi:hypothetical protein
MTATRTLADPVLNADSDLLTSGNSHLLRITVTLCPDFAQRPLPWDCECILVDYELQYLEFILLFLFLIFFL